MNGLQAPLPGIAMQHDVLYHHDSVVNYQSHSGGQPAQRHQVEALIEKLERNECHQNRDGNDEAGDDGRSPISQEHHQNNGSENQSQENGIPHALDGIINDDRLIIEWPYLNTRRQRLPYAIHFRVHQRGNLHRIAFGLPVDVQEHCRLTVRRDDRIQRFYPGNYRADVSDPNWDPRRSCLDHCVGDLLGSTHLAANQTKYKLMIALKKSWRIDQICFLKAVENVSNCDVGGEQLGGVDRNVKLGLLSALHQHRGNTVQPIQPRFHLVGGSFPELGLRYGIGREAVAHDGEAGERHSVRNHSGGWRQFSLNPRDRCIYVLQRLEHVYIPIKKQIDFRRTATGNGTNFLQSRNAVHGFLDRTGDCDHHLINRHYAVVDGDQDSRKIGFWEN